MKNNQLSIQLLSEEFTICRFPPDQPPSLAEIDARPVFVAHTMNEFSIVLPTHQAMKAPVTKAGWRCFKIRGTLSFDQVGIISAISSVLASGNISIFVLSTYDTDYFMVLQETLERTIRILEQSGHVIIQIE